MKKLFQISGLVAVLLLTGCNAPIYNVQNHPININKSNDAIYAAIKKGAENAYWTIEKINSNEVFANFVVRIHKATVKITYDNEKYSIKYFNGVNLTFRPSDNTIHENYNKWVQNLEDSINIELSKLQ